MSKQVTKAAIVGCVLLLSGCGAMALPEPYVAPVKPDGEDCAVLTTVLRDFLRTTEASDGVDVPGAGRPIRWYLVDTTVSLCRYDPVALPAGCLFPEWLGRAKNEVHVRRAETRPSAASIRCSFPANVRFLPAGTRLQEALRDHTPRAIAAFSAPVYSSRRALVFYREFFMRGGVVRLEWSRGRWQVRSNSSWLE